MTLASQILHHLTDIIHSNARHYRDVSLQHRKLIVASILRNIQKQGRFIRLKKNMWQVISDEEAFRKIEDRIRYTFQRNAARKGHVGKGTMTSCCSKNVARKSDVHTSAQTISPIQCIPDEPSKVVSAPALNKRLNLNALSIREILLEANHAIETTLAGGKDSNHGFKIASSLCDLDCASGIHCTGHIRQQYMEYLCARYLSKDDSNDHGKLSQQKDNKNTGLTPDNASESNGCNGDELQQIINRTNHAEVNEKFVDTWLFELISASKKSSNAIVVKSNLNSDGVDYLSLPIDVDESILNFLNPMDK